MATPDVKAPQPASAPEPALPDYLLDPDAVLKDTDTQWRYGRAPDYSKTRISFAETKQMSHVAGSLPDLVQNLVKNWEVEASFKPRLSDWRTIDHDNYSFAINGGPAQDAQHMLKVGTYNAIISANEYYDPKYSDFATSHKTFKRMMPTFAWEVLEVYSGPPVVAFRWRHWGTMKNDYVGFNNQGEKVTAKAHGGQIDIQGVTVAHVDEKVRLQSVQTWFDPMDMFRQIAPGGIVNKQPIESKVDTSRGLQSDRDLAEEPQRDDGAPREVDAMHIDRSFIGTEIGSGCPFLASQSGNTPKKNMLNAERYELLNTVKTLEPTAEPMMEEHESNIGNDQNIVQAPGSANSTESWSPIEMPAVETFEGATNGVEAPTSALTSRTSTEQNPTEAKPEQVTSAEQTSRVESVPETVEHHKPTTGVTDTDVGAASSTEKENVQLPRAIEQETKSTVNVGPGAMDIQQTASADPPAPPQMIVEGAPTMEQVVKPEPGEAVATPGSSVEAEKTQQEMSTISASESVGLMNHE